MTHRRACLPAGSPPGAGVRVFGVAYRLVPLALAFVVVACAPSAPARPAPLEPPAIAPASDVPSRDPSEELRRAAFSTVGWKTDFSRRTVDLSEISSGGPPRDGIPPIDRPVFQTVGEAKAWLAAAEPVILLEVGSEARAYPLQVLTWHEIVNDDVGGIPVAVTFCPLCNTAIAFDRRVGERTLDFGTTGNLRRSDLIMWDRQTESWWQQIDGAAIVGEMAGTRLTAHPSPILAWADVTRSRPDARVLSRETGFNRTYGVNPYVGYDRIDQPPFMFRGPADGRLPPKERVVAVETPSGPLAVAFALLRQRRVVQEPGMVILFAPGALSALDQTDIARSKDVGAAAVFRPEVDGRVLTFFARDEGFMDLETGSRWSLLGVAVEGPMVGSRLEPLNHSTPFWFAWAAFRPETRLVS